MVNEKDTGFLQSVRNDHHRYYLRAVVGRCVVRAAVSCYSSCYVVFGIDVKGVCTMIQFCIGVIVGFAIAAMVQVGKRSDKEMGCDDEVSSK